MSVIWTVTGGNRKIFAVMRRGKVNRMINFILGFVTGYASLLVILAVVYFIHTK